MSIVSEAHKILERHTFVETERLPGGKWEITVREPVEVINDRYGIPSLDVTAAPFSSGPLKYKDAMLIRRTAKIRHALKYLGIPDADKVAERLESSHSTMVDAVITAISLR